MPKGNPSLLYSAPCEAGFGAESFEALARRLFSNVSTEEGRIRSGRHIPRGFKSVVSSYRIVGSHLPPVGGGKVILAAVKLCPGITVTPSVEESVIKFAESCAVSEGADGALVCVPPQEGWRGLVVLAASPAVKSVSVPQELMDFICAEGLKTYLHKSCGLTEAALDGWLSGDKIIFDDSLIKLNAAKLDAALASVRFCDIAASDGKIVLAVAEKVAAARTELNRYLGSAQSRRPERFAAEFVKNCLWATDCSAAALDILSVALLLKYGAAPAVGRLAWGSVLVDGVMDGEQFDLVISKPPHVRGEQFASIRPLLGGYASAQFGADLYCYYVEKAASLLSPSGSAVMLVSNKWMKSRYGEGLRRFFALRPPRMIADLGSAPHITGSAMPLCVLSFYREAPRDEPLLVVESGGEWNGLRRAAVSARACERGAEELGGEPWSFSASDRKNLEAKIYEKSIPLSSCAGVYRGVLTGLNEAFVIDADDAAKIAAEEPASEKILVPFYSGRDVKRYYLPEAKKKLIFMPKGYTDRRRELEEADRWFAQNHPLVAARLAPFERRAAKRRDKGDYWWELRPCKYGDVFERGKIILPVITKRLSAAYSEGVAYVNDKCCVVDGGGYFLLALLNSKLMDYVFRARSPELLNGYYELRTSALAALPVRRVNLENEARRALMEEIEAAGKRLSELYAQNPPGKYKKQPEETLETERSLDRAVYRLYNLSPKEIKIVEDN